LTIRTVIFAKSPTPGFAKTRLIPALGEVGAARLAQRMLEAAIVKAIAAETGPVELCVTPDVDDPVWQSPRWTDVTVTSQGDGDLGVRMARASQRVIGSGEAIVLIGTDCIELDVAQIRDAAAALARHDLVLSPTFDGGYALIGLKQFHAALFGDIAWSTNTVAQTTIARATTLGLNVHLGPKLHDIDEIEDLRWLPQDWRDELGITA
jgi:uncharacterized protein